VSVTDNLHVAAGHWEAGRARAKATVDWEDWRERARAIRADAVARMPELIGELERTFRGTVHRAATDEDARRIVVELCAGARMVVKGKSMLSEEIELNGALSAAGIEPVETDLGEYLVQRRGERPSHILAPAVHLSARQAAQTLGLDSGDAGELVAHARALLREKFLAADVGITGVNIAVAKTGTLIIVESEGNIRLSCGLPKRHVAIMGLEKVVADWTGAAHLMQILPLAAHGRPAPTYASLVSAPDPGHDLHLVLVDNGRSGIRGSEVEEVLQCIRCGACLYACPVYRQVGGHAYEATYSGPIGAVFEHARTGERPDLPWMSSLCGACADACPVKIPLDRQLVQLRHARGAEGALWRTWARAWSTPRGYRATTRVGTRAMAPWLQRLLGWAGEREALEPARESFRERWEAKRGR
jgi:L-lactate dehydrogenase complex protein LldF